MTERGKNLQNISFVQGSERDYLDLLIWLLSSESFCCLLLLVTFSLPIEKFDLIFFWVAVTQ